MRGSGTTEFEWVNRARATVTGKRPNEWRKGVVALGVTAEKQIPSCSIYLSLSFFICQFESQAGGTSAHSTATMPTIFCSPPLSSTTTEPFRAQEHSPKDNMSSVRASTHSLPLQVSKAFPFCCWRPIRPPTLTTPIRPRRRFGFDRCRRRRCFSATPHPHRVAVILIQMETSLFGIASTKKKKRRRNSAHSSCLCLCGRPLARSTWNESSTFHKFERALLLLHIAFAFAALLFSGVAGGGRQAGGESRVSGREERRGWKAEVRGRERMFRLGVAFFAFREGTW